MAAMSDDGLEALANRRRISGDLYLIWCRDCGCKIRATKELLREEYEGEPVVCHACRGFGTNGGYGGSPQEARDFRYHGERFYAGDW